MSAWGKLLVPVVVPTGGWAWSWGSGFDATNYVTVPAGTYGTILSLADALEDEIDKVAGSYVEISSTGIASVRINYLTAVHWISCADSLLTTLGYTEEEEVVSPNNTQSTVTASLHHRYGWYPGVASHGAARGEGLAGDSAWQVADEVGFEAETMVVAAHGPGAQEATLGSTTTGTGPTPAGFRSRSHRGTPPGLGSLKRPQRLLTKSLP
jgi:hypothetical protein